jgi:hypothetical protein
VRNHVNVVEIGPIGTSRRPFTPAALLSPAGFLAPLKGTWDTNSFLGAGVGLVVAGGVALARRPDLGAD